MQNVASAALQEAYDDLAVRFNQLELENAKQQMQLVSTPLFLCGSYAQNSRCIVPITQQWCVYVTNMCSQIVSDRSILLHPACHRSILLATRQSVSAVHCMH